MTCVDRVRKRDQSSGICQRRQTDLGHLRVMEFLRFCGQARGLFGEGLNDAIDHVSQRLDLSSVLRRPLNQLSKGWRQRAWVAQAIIHDPRVLVLDEPTDGLDPNQKDLVRDLVRELSRDRTILLSTHILEEAEELCDRVIVLDKGIGIEDAPLADLTDSNGRLSAHFRQLTKKNAVGRVNPDNH